MIGGIVIVEARFLNREVKRAHKEANKTTYPLTTEMPLEIRAAMHLIQQLPSLDRNTPRDTRISNGGPAMPSAHPRAVWTGWNDLVTSRHCRSHGSGRPIPSVTLTRTQHRTLEDMSAARGLRWRHAESRGQSVSPPDLSQQPATAVAPLRRLFPAAKPRHGHRRLVMVLP